MHPKDKTDSEDVFHTLKIEDNEFNKLSCLIKQQFGIHLGIEKKTLVESRLRQLLIQYNIKNFTEYYSYLQSERSAERLGELVDHISTNHTFFYREAEHFEYFKKEVFPEILVKHKNRNSRDVRVWCAAAASGEEPYVLLMTMMDVLGKDYKNWDCGLLATDVSAHALNIAKKGLYETRSTSQLPQKFLKNYFDQYNESLVQVKDFVRQNMTYRRFNLMNAQFPFKKSFDAIFCRNVMIYFDHQTKVNLIRQLNAFMEVGACLFLGLSESLPRNEDLGFDYVQPSVYKKVA